MPQKPQDLIAIDDNEYLRRLRLFLRQLEELLADLADQPRSIMPARVHVSMLAAWAEVRPMFDTAVASLLHPTPDQIDKLRAAGLLGPQLEFKLSVFEYRRDELLDHGTPMEAQGKKRSWLRRLLGLFKPALKAADVILGSLAEALPGNPFGVIKEYKESVESGVEVGRRLGS
jgi:hypothetical protein